MFCAHRKKTLGGSDFKTWLLKRCAFEMTPAGYRYPAQFWPPHSGLSAFGSLRQMSISSLYGSRCVLVLSSKGRGSAVTSASWQCTFVSLFVHYKAFKNSLKFRARTFTFISCQWPGPGWTFTEPGVCGVTLRVRTQNSEYSFRTAGPDIESRSSDKRYSDRPA